MSDGYQVSLEVYYVAAESLFFQDCLSEINFRCFSDVDNGWFLHQKAFSPCYWLPGFLAWIRAVEPHWKNWRGPPAGCLQPEAAPCVFSMNNWEGCDAISWAASRFSTSMTATRILFYTKTVKARRLCQVSQVWSFAPDQKPRP